MSEVRVVKIPGEVKEVYNTDTELARLRKELRSAGGKLGALTKQYQRQVQPLRVKIDELQEQLRGRKVVLARIHGWAFPSLEELNQRAGCSLHPNAKVVWIPAGKLAEKRGETTVLQGAMCGRRTVDAGRSVRGKLAELNRYELKCTQCYLEEKDSPDKVAHDCPNCGIVRGNPQRFHEERSLYQDDYIYCHCWLCGGELGYVVIGGLIL